MDYPKLSNNKDVETTTPICRCRVSYLGSSVPHLTKDGLQGVQEPLKELYPDNEASVGLSVGIDSWISVWSNGILIENVDDLGRDIRRFFPIESLHYCAAVRFVNLPDSAGVTKFLPLDSPYLRHAKSNHPPLFACILRRTTGIKVLECHAFVCSSEKAANSLVRCCFHAYADNEYVKQMDESPYAQINNRNSENNKDQLDGVKYTSNWDGTDVTDSDNTASSTQPASQKLNQSSIQNHSNTNSKKLMNGKQQQQRNLAELNSDDTEIMTTNSSISQNSPEEDEDVTLLNGYTKRWPASSKSLSGSIKNLTLSNKEVIKIAKGASMRSLRPRQMVIPNMLAPTPMPFIPVHALPQLFPHPSLSIDKKSSKLLKKMKSKSMITLIPQPPTTPIPPHAIPIGPIGSIKSGQVPHQLLQQLTSSKQQHQMMFMNHPGANLYNGLPLLPQMVPVAPQLITGNLHSIKKKSKKNKEKQQMLQQMNASHEMQFMGQPQPIYIPPMRPLTPLANYLGNQNGSMNNTPYLIQKIGPQHSSIYHTAPRNRKEIKSCKNNKKDKLSGIDPEELQAMINNQNYHNQKQQQQQQQQQQQLQTNNRSNSNSPFNTGIYRKKGMMNERAFSYSIRNEHRSRSNSVANLNFNADEIDNAAQMSHQEYILNNNENQMSSQQQHQQQRKLSQNGNAILNNQPNNQQHNSTSSQGSPSSISKQQIARQQQQQYYLQQQQLNDALNNLQLNAPKTASIKRSKLNNNKLLFPNGQLNGQSSNKNDYDLNNQMMHPPIFGKLVLPQMNGNLPPLHHHQDHSIKQKKVK